MKSKRRFDRGQQGQASVWMAIILVLIGTYFIFTYLPPWYKSWKAKNVVGEVISGTNNYDEDNLRTSITHSLSQMGVDVSSGDVSIEIDEQAKHINVEIRWPAVIEFPFTRKTTKIDFIIRVKRKTG